MLCCPLALTHFLDVLHQIHLPDWISKHPQLRSEPPLCWYALHFAVLTWICSHQALDNANERALYTCKILNGADAPVVSFL